MRHRSGATVIRLSATTPTEARNLPADYLSLTIDTSLLLGGHWWGPKKGLRNGVSGERTPALDLKNERLRSYARSLSPAMLRIGGTEADRLSYRMGKKAAAAYGPVPRDPAEGNTDVSHEFVLRKGLWRRLHAFLSEVGFSLLFTLSAGPADRDAEGKWKDDNARKLIAYSRRKGYPVAAWELGNEVNAYPFIYGLSRRVSGRRRTVRDALSAPGGRVVLLANHAPQRRKGLRRSRLLVGTQSDQEQISTPTHRRRTLGGDRAGTDVSWIDGYGLCPGGNSTAFRALPLLHHGTKETFR